MQRIDFANGESLEVTYCGVSDGVLFFEVIDDGGVLEYAEKFSDPERTGLITYQMDDLPPHVYEGYTRLLSVSKSRWNGYMTINLIQGEG